MSADTDTDASTPLPADTLSVFSDFVCPFCYLGRESLRTYRDERAERGLEGIDVEWQFFDLRGHKRGPDGEIRDDVDDGKDEDYYDQVRENVARLREEYGAEEMLPFDEVPDVDSWDAQQAALYVKRNADRETFLAFYDAVLEAFWRDGREIDDPDVLAELAASVDLDPEEIRAAMTDEALAADLADAFERARELGVTGVPTFVYDGHAARGAVPPAHLARLLEDD